MGSPIGVHLLVIISPFCPVYPVTTPINIYIYIYWNDIIYTYINININIILHTHLFASYPHFPWYHIKNPHFTSVVITAHFWMRISLTEHRGYESKLRSLFIGTLQIVGLLPPVICLFPQIYRYYSQLFHQICLGYSPSHMAITWVFVVFRMSTWSTWPTWMLRCTVYRNHALEFEESMADVTGFLLDSKIDPHWLHQVLEYHMDCLGI